VFLQHRQGRDGGAKVDLQTTGEDQAETGKGIRKGIEVWMAATSEEAAAREWTTEAGIAPTNCQWKGSDAVDGASQDNARSSTSHPFDHS
jgi:hypothetical protein